ncbi:MAG: BON domain-containing protein [Planctomycetaceae bacterium]
MASCNSPWVVITTLAVGVVVSTASPAAAQLFGQSSPNSGQNGRGTASMGARGSTSGASGSQMQFGGPSLGGQSTGSQGLGQNQTGLGQAQGSMRGSTAGGRFVGMRQSGQAAQMPNINGMMNGRNNRNGMLNQFGQQGQFGQQNRNNQNRNRNQPGQQGMGQNFNGQSNQAQSRQIRPTLKVGFEFDPAEVTPAQTRLAARIEKLNDRKQFQGIDMRTEGDTVVLRGVAKDAATKRLMEKMAMLEPAIKSVRNEIRVVGEARDEDE